MGGEGLAPSVEEMKYFLGKITYQDLRLAASLMVDAGFEIKYPTDVAVFAHIQTVFFKFPEDTGGERDLSLHVSSDGEGNRVSIIERVEGSRVSMNDIGACLERMGFSVGQNGGGECIFSLSEAVNVEVGKNGEGVFRLDNS